jgi:hypothetical protein
MTVNKALVRKALRGTDLGRRSAAWKGWRLIGDQLVGPQPDLRISVRDANTFARLHTTLDFQRQEIKALQERIEELNLALRMQEQPFPEGWAIPTLQP